MASWKDPVFEKWWPLGQSLTLVRAPVRRVAKAMKAEGKRAYRSTGAVYTKATQMEKTFRLAKRHRNLGVVCLIFFVLVGIASAYGIWAEAPEERRTYALYAAAIFGAFWGSFACLACWLLLAYFELCCLGVAIAGLAIFKFWRPPMPLALILGAAAVVLWFGVLLWRAHQLDRQRRERDKANAVVAARQWDDGETAA